MASNEGKQVWCWLVVGGYWSCVVLDEELTSLGGVGCWLVVGGGASGPVASVLFS